MRVLLDECLNEQFASKLPGVTVETVRTMGWKGVKNGALLTRAQGAFDVFLTIDRGIAHQQNVSKFNIAILLMLARSNRMSDLEPLADAVMTSIKTAARGTVTVVNGT
jgi:hypothetical protein